jgi:hypothetical protein
LRIFKRIVWLPRGMDKIDLNNFWLRFPGTQYRERAKGIQEAERLFGDLDRLIESEGFDLSKFNALLCEREEIHTDYEEFQRAVVRLRGGIAKGGVSQSEEEQIERYLDSIIKINDASNQIIEPLYHRMRERGYSHFELTG